MREILFRGKRIGNGEWVEGYYAKAQDYISEIEFHIIFPLDLELFPHSEFSTFEDIAPETACQYTGLKDKNGTKIFEGDVVKAVLPPTDSRAGFEWPVAAVVYQNCVFGFVDRHGGITPLSGYASSVQFEVIGNVHDNPELMEVRYAE